MQDISNVLRELNERLVRLNGQATKPHTPGPLSGKEEEGDIP